MNKLLKVCFLIYLSSNWIYGQLLPFEMPCECQDERFHIWNIKKANNPIFIKWRGNFVITSIEHLKESITKNQEIDYLLLYNILYNGRSLPDVSQLKNASIFQLRIDSLNYYQKEWTEKGSESFLEQYFDFKTNPYHWVSKSSSLPYHLQYFLFHKCFILNMKNNKIGISVYNINWHPNLLKKLLLKNYELDFVNYLFSQLENLTDLEEIYNTLKNK